VLAGSIDVDAHALSDLGVSDRTLCAGDSALVRRTGMQCPGAAAIVHDIANRVAGNTERIHGLYPGTEVLGLPLQWRGIADPTGQGDAPAAGKIAAVGGEPPDLKGRRCGHDPRSRADLNLGTAGLQGVDTSGERDGRDKARAGGPPDH